MNMHCRFLIILFFCAGFLAGGCKKQSNVSVEDQFIREMNVGKNFLDKGAADKAVPAYQAALKLNPTHPDVHLNLANSYLLLGDSTNAISHANEVIALDKNSAAAYFVLGCAYLRQGNAVEALKALQQSKTIDASVAATSFQLGVAHQQLRNWEEAVLEFQTTIALEPEHPAAHYNLSQVLARLNREAEANQELEAHRAITAKHTGPPLTTASFERSKHTQARAPFKLEQPALEGVAITFRDKTDSVLGEDAARYTGPIGVLDINHRGTNDLFVLETGKGFRLLQNQNSRFSPLGEPMALTDGVTYQKCLVGDLQNDRFEDVIVLGDKGSQVFKFATNGAMTDVSPVTRLATVSALDGALVDLDFTGKLDLLAVNATNGGVRVYRNLGNLFFRDITATSGVPATALNAQSLVVEDWNNDDLADLFISSEQSGTIFLAKQRGGPLVQTNLFTNLVGKVLAAADFNNDFRTDLIVASQSGVRCIFAGGLPEQSLASVTAQKALPFDYDNDGWLDVVFFGRGVSIWRNLGQAGFRNESTKLGLQALADKEVRWISAADLDTDCDTDLVLSVEGGGLRVLSNEGGNANKQLKVRLFGNRSNASGLGVRLEMSTAGLRTMRTLHSLPMEIGIGNHAKVDSLTVRWFDLALNEVDIEVKGCETRLIPELILPTGSCPYLYAWDGRGFRFVTDLLGASPLGLKISESRYIESDPDEYVWVGNETNFQPRDGAYVLQITEELKEVLYLDHAALVVVDHPPNAEVHPTDKLLPGKPFPTGELLALVNPRKLRHAENDLGRDVTGALEFIDNEMVSPPKLRVPQLRGLAEQHSLLLDFGPLDATKPLVLALTGWLRFGGGMANVGASHDESLPFPFPMLEAETPEGWKKVEVTVGAPAGKTKTILVDLQSKIPASTTRLRLSTAFEIHWDRIILLERSAETLAQHKLLPARTDLHWRGYSPFKDLPSWLPQTPDYHRVNAVPNWRLTLTGWCTRYGPVNELLEKTDDAFVLLNGGDELSLYFDVASMPPKKPGHIREFFLYTDGWDKDGDFHVAHGSKVEPLPFHGMDDQRYGIEPRPTRDDSWIKKYNTRWVGPVALKPAGK